MRKKMILAAFILMLNFGTVWADIADRPRPQQQPSVQRPNPSAPVEKPVEPISPKEEQKQGVCFSPVIVAGLFFSLSMIAFGLRFLRGHEIQTKTAEVAS